MHTQKIIASLGVLLCVFVNFSAVAYADTTVSFSDYRSSVLYEIADTTDSILNIEDETAYCISSATGTNTARITIKHTLQKYWGLWIWNDVKGAEWSRTEERNSVRLSNSISGLDSGTYRVKSVFTLTNKSGKSETITVYSETKSVP